MHLLKANFQLNQINTALKRKIKNTSYKDEKSKQTESYKYDEITKNKRKKYVKITYLTKKKETI